MPSFDNNTLLLAFVGVTALAIVLQTIILLAVFAAVRKAAVAVKEEAEDLRSSMMPIIYNSRDLYARLAPKVEATVDDLAAIAHGLRTQTEALETSAVQMMEKLHRQTSRMDVMFSTVLDAVDRAGGFVAETISRPVRQATSLIASIRAIIESLRTPGVEPHDVHTAADKDMFV